MVKNQSLKAAKNKAARKKASRKNRTNLDNTKQVTESVEPQVNTDPMQDPKVVEALKELKKLKASNTTYQRAMFLMEGHLKGCKDHTGEISIEDIDYSIGLVKRMVAFASK